MIISGAEHYKYFDELDYGVSYPKNSIVGSETNPYIYLIPDVSQIRPAFSGYNFGDVVFLQYVNTSGKVSYRSLPLSEFDKTRTYDRNSVYDFTNYNIYFMGQKFSKWITVVNKPAINNNNKELYFIPQRHPISTPFYRLTASSILEAQVVLMLLTEVNTWLSVDNDPVKFVFEKKEFEASWYTKPKAFNINRFGTKSPHYSVALYTDSNPNLRYQAALMRGGQFTPLGESAKKHLIMAAMSRGYYLEEILSKFSYFMLLSEFSWNKTQ